MRTRFTLVVLVVLFITSFATVYAQQEMAHVVCDADLILSLYTAEYNFGFGAIHDQMMVDNPDMQLPNFEAYDTGQFAPLFASMMTMMNEDMSMPDSMMNEEMMTSVMDAMSMDQAAMDTAMGEMMPEGTDTSAMTALVAPTVADEPAECTALRDELRHFYTSLAYSSMMMNQEG